MLARHTRHFDRRLLGPFRVDVHDGILEEIKIVDSGEGLSGAFRLGKVVLCVGCRDDGKIPAERGFDLLVEMVPGM